MSRGPHPAAVAQTTPQALSGRSLLDRLAVRISFLAAPFIRLLFRLPRGRRDAILRYLLARGYAAFNRRDWELNTIGIHPERFTYGPYERGVLPPDAKAEYHGVDGYLEALNLWLAGPAPITRSLLVKMVDAGDGVIVAIIRAKVSGEASGLEFEQRLAEVLEFEDGWRVRQTVFWDADQALRSVGVDPQAVVSASEEPSRVVITRVEQPGAPRRSRDLVERLMVRFPWAWRALSPGAQRLLRPGSRLRRALIRREVLSAYQATSRGDLELLEVRYAPDAVLEFDPDFKGVGFSGPFSSVTEREEAFQQEWQRFEVAPAAVIDLGDLFVVLGSLRVTGMDSGVELEAEVGQVVTARRGLVVRDQIFLSWERGLRAAGLNPGEIRRCVTAETGPFCR